MFKKLFGLLSVCLCLFMLTGCVNIQYSRINFADGKTVDRLAVVLDKDNLQANGYNMAALTSAIQADLNLRYLDGSIGVRTFKNQCNNNNNLTDESKKFIRDNLLADCSIASDLTQVVAEITFLNSEVFELYYAWVNAITTGATPSEGESNEDVIDTGLTSHKTFFHIEYTQKSTSMFANAFDYSITQNLITAYNASFNLYNHYSAEEDVSFTQIYGTHNTKMQSNAQDTEISAGVKLHYWLINPKDNTQTMEFYYTAPNTPNWYLCAIAVALFVTFAIMLFNRGRNKKITATQNGDYSYTKKDLVSDDVEAKPNKKETQKTTSIFNKRNTNKTNAPPKNKHTEPTQHKERVYTNQDNIEIEIEFDD